MPWRLLCVPAAARAIRTAPARDSHLPVYVSTIMQADDSDQRSRPARSTVEWRRWLFRASMTVIVASAVAIIWALPVHEFALALRNWAESMGPWAAIVFAIAFVLMSVFSIPVWPMPFIAGAVLGTLGGWLTASISCTLGAAVNFGIARWIGRSRFREYLERSPRLRALEKTVASESWKVVAAVRLSHFLTFGMQNYAFGLTRIAFLPYILATWAVTLPGIFLQSYLGDLGFTSMESWQSQGATDWQSWSLRIGGLLAIAGAVAYLGYFMRRAYRDAIEEQLQHELEIETARDHRRAPSWPAFTAAVCAILLAGMAVWSVIERESIRRYVDRELTSSPLRQHLPRREYANLARPINGNPP